MLCSDMYVFADYVPVFCVTKPSIVGCELSPDAWRGEEAREDCIVYSIGRHSHQSIISSSPLCSCDLPLGLATLPCDQLLWTVETRHSVAPPARQQGQAP